jgi:uncharacterized membrane protein (DUF485 family)
MTDEHAEDRFSGMLLFGSRRAFTADFSPLIEKRWCLFCKTAHWSRQRRRNGASHLKSRSEQLDSKKKSLNWIDEKKFQELVVRKWKISLVLTAIMMVVYFGFILVLAFKGEILATKLGEHMTLGIPVGLAIIVLACILTGIYVFWANSSYDKSIEDILKTMPRR